MLSLLISKYRTKILLQFSKKIKILLILIAAISDTVQFSGDSIKHRDHFNNTCSYSKWQFFSVFQELHTLILLTVAMS